MKPLLWAFLVAVSLVNAADVESNVLVKSSASWDGTPLPAYPKEAPEITVLKITIPPHSKLAVHEHPIINVGYLVKGELKVVGENNQSKTLKAGDALIEMVHQWHYGENTSDEAAEIVVVYAGTKESPLSIKR